MKRSTLLVIVISSMVVATVAFAARSLRSDEADTADAKETPEGADDASETVTAKPAVVKTAKVATADLTETFVANGTTAAIREVTVAAEIAGKIEYLGADMGDRVRRGQVLARIDYETLKAERNRAAAAYDLAKATYDRFAALGEDIVSRQKIDETRSGMVTSRAGLSIANNAVEKSVIRSGMKGVVTGRLMEKGEFATPGAPILHVVDYSTIVVEAQLAETEIAAVRKGAGVDVRIDALDETFEGEVKTVLPMADAASKTFTVRVEIDNKDLRILVGMSASLTIAARTHEDVVVVPQDLVIESREGRSVFVVEDGIAKERKVTLGPTQADRVVVTDGIEAGETLVVLGHRNLTDGQPVTIAK